MSGMQISKCRPLLHVRRRPLLEVVRLARDGAVGLHHRDAIHNEEDCIAAGDLGLAGPGDRSEEHTSELQSLMRISYAVFCLKKKKSKVQLLLDTTKNTSTLETN